MVSRQRSTVTKFWRVMDADEEKNIPYQECDGIGTVIYLAKDGKFAGSILIADTIKPETEDAIRGLKAAGIRRTVMLTGDRKAVSEAVAAKVGIDRGVHGAASGG